MGRIRRGLSGHGAWDMRPPRYSVPRLNSEMYPMAADQIGTAHVKDGLRLTKEYDDGGKSYYWMAEKLKDGQWSMIPESKGSKSTAMRCYIKHLNERRN